MLSGRMEDKASYCFYQYLQVMMRGDGEQKDSLIRLLEKYAAGEDSEVFDGFFYLLLIQLNEELRESPAALLVSMEEKYAKGCHSPVSYTHLDVYKRQVWRSTVGGWH